MFENYLICIPSIYPRAVAGGQVNVYASKIFAVKVKYLSVIKISINTGINHKAMISTYFVLL